MVWKNPIDQICNKISIRISGAPAARRAAKRSPITIACIEINPCNYFLLVNMDRGRVRPATTSRNMATLLRLIRTKSCSLCLQRVSFVLNIYAMVNWHLSKQGIRWPVSCDHIVGSGLELIEVLFVFKLTTDQALVFRLDRGLMSY